MSDHGAAAWMPGVLSRAVSESTIGMAIHVVTARPVLLLERLAAAIQALEVLTWRFSSDGIYITSTEPEWEGRGWLRPRVEELGLTLSIVRPQGGAVDRETYAELHGRAVTLLIGHFGTYFDQLVLQPEPGPDDVL